MSLNESQYVLKELDRLSMVVIQSTEQLQVLRMEVNVTREVRDERMVQLRETLRQGHQEMSTTLQRLQTIVQGNGQASMLQRFALLEERMAALDKTMTQRLETLEGRATTDTAWWWKIGGDLLKMALVALAMYLLALYKKL